MTRYFEQFFITSPMVELDESTARASGTYAVLLDDPPRYEVYSGGTLSRLVYADRAAPGDALADLRARRPGVRAEIYTPVATAGDVRTYRTWYVKADGELEALKEYELHGRRKMHERWFTPEGAPAAHRDFIYDDDGLVEVRTYGADGTLMSREDA